MSWILLTTGTSVLLTYAVARAGEAAGWGADARRGVQHFHSHPASRLGGLAILAALAAPLLADPALRPWLLCLLPACAAGVAEDVSGRVQPWTRLLLTAGGAALAWHLLDARVVRLGPAWLDGALVAAPLLSLALTTLFVAGAAHAVNIIDGYNGLAGAYATMALLVIAAVAGEAGDPGLAHLALTGAAATAGFLAWNFPRGRVFLGDGGAYLLGTLVGLLAVRLVHDHAQVSPMCAALVLAYPAWETLASIHRKLVVRGRSPLRPDGLHLHMLVHKRLVRSCRRELSAAQRRVLNSATLMYMLPLMLVSLLPALLLWDRGPLLLACCGGFILAYTRLYGALVGFRLPRQLALRTVVAASLDGAPARASLPRVPVSG